MCDPITGWYFDKATEKMVYGPGGIAVLNATIGTDGASVSCTPPPPLLTAATEGKLPRLSNLVRDYTSTSSYLSPAFANIAVSPAAVMAGGAYDADERTRAALAFVEQTCEELVDDERLHETTSQVMRAISRDVQTVLSQSETLLANWSAHIDTLLLQNSTSIQAFNADLRRLQMQGLVNDMTLLAPLVVQALNAYMQRVNADQYITYPQFDAELQASVHVLYTFLYGPLQAWFNGMFNNYETYKFKPKRTAAADIGGVTAALVTLTQAVQRDAVAARQAAERVLSLCTQDGLWSRTQRLNILTRLKYDLYPQLQVFVMFILSVVLQVLFIDNEFLEALSTASTGEVAGTALSALTVIASALLWLKNNSIGLTSMWLERLTQSQSYKLLNVYTQQLQYNGIKTMSQWMVRSMFTEDDPKADYYVLLIQGMLLLLMPVFTVQMVSKTVYKMAKWAHAHSPHVRRALFGEPVIRVSDYALICSEYDGERICEVVNKKYLPRDRQRFTSLEACRQACQ